MSGPIVEEPEMTAIQPHVMVAVTGDHPMDAAFAYAAAEATARGCGVHLVHVHHDLNVGSPEVAELRLVDRELRKAGIELLERAAKQVRAMVDDEVVAVSTELVHGLVTPSLVDCSEHACLVVLQGHQRGRLARLSTLSVTSAVAARAHVPVVVVPEAWAGPGAEGAPVVVGVEDAETGQGLVRLALDEARRSGLPVRLVQCWWISQTYEDIVFGDRSAPEHTERLQRLMVSGLAPLLSEYDVATEIVVRHEAPADALVRESRRGSLLVVGRHHPALPFGSHIGPITRTVLREAVCPVLVTKLD
jgi:nucleotide-binding universal stress UspA family protein